MDLLLTELGKLLEEAIWKVCGGFGMGINSFEHSEFKYL